MRTAEHLGGTFKDSRRAAVHRWFNYPAGFSNTLVYELLDEFGIGPGSGVVLDPFAGAGTTLVAARERGVASLGLEAHPLVQRIGLAKLDWELFERVDLPRAIRTVLDAMPQTPPIEDPAASQETYPALLEKCFPGDVLAALTRARIAAQQTAGDDAALWRFFMVGLLAVLRQVATVGTASWQYVLPNKARRGGPPVALALERQWTSMAADLECVLRQAPRPLATATLLETDARLTSSLENTKDAAACITSPPYLNNYDYADATRLELYFLGQAQTWGDITRDVRTQLVRSATTQMTRRTNGHAAGLDDGLPETVRQELEQRVSKMAAERTSHGGKKNYDLVCAAYFSDMLQVLRRLANSLRPGAPALWIVGDSAPYGVHVPTERYLGEIALSVGFRGYTVHELRRRNVKWRNRKHRVPLSESMLVLTR